MSDLAIPTVETTDRDDPKIRLLVCKTCKSIQPIPDFEGPVDHDDGLIARVAEHQYPGTRRGHEMDLGRVSEVSWNNPDKRDQMMSELMKQVGVGKGEGFGQTFYDVRSTYAEDAMSCWRFKHNRTSDCDDYMTQKMALLSDTAADRKELGLDPKGRSQQRLCQYCPVHSVVMSKKNKAKGL